MTSEKTEIAIARADRVMRSLDERDGAARDAAKRERQRLNAGLGKTLGRIGIAVLLISIATIIIGLVKPIGMFGFLAAVGLAVGVGAMLLFSGGREIAAPNVTPGKLKFVWLTALKNSARNCMPKRSVIEKFLARLKSKFTSPGARTIPTPELPKI